MINYSIIIPHKNIPKLLQRCLNSIPQRDDLEIIVVDDNSDPSIVDFGQFPGAGRSDVSFFFDKSGKGAGRARNIGLQHAQGKWLLFADADDFFKGGHVYQKGYFDYERDGFGEVEYDAGSTVDRIIEYIENDCQLKPKYRERIDRFFAFNDKNNCERIVKKILEMD